MDKNALLKSGVELYTGKTVVSLDRYDDPITPGAVALRVFLRKGKKTFKIDFLISVCPRPAPLRTAEDVENVLEEVEFTSWPPTFGRQRFFY